jgi:flagellar motor switch protein FliG
MNVTSHNLRKAAVLLGSLDAQTSASLLAQLSPDEAIALRAAVQSLGPIDSEERADVVAEFRRAAPMAAKSAADGVELRFSSQSKNQNNATSVVPPAATSAKPFEFLEKAPIDALAPYLAREHAQTIALVLSHLPPVRAAKVLAALPHKLQADTIERLALLGETDSESVVVVERELADWMATRSTGRSSGGRRSDSVSSILAAADAATRSALLTNLKTHKAVLARQFAISEPMPNRRPGRNAAAALRQAVVTEGSQVDFKRAEVTRRARQLLKPASAPLPRFNFDELIHLEDQMLAGLLRDVDPSVFALALVGSHDELIDRICGQMPKRVAREFRRRLRQTGPTRLSDVEAAQQSVARTAVQRLSEQRSKRLAPTA